MSNKDYEKNQSYNIVPETSSFDSNLILDLTIPLV